MTGAGGKFHSFDKGSISDYFCGLGPFIAGAGTAVFLFVCFATGVFRLSSDDGRIILDDRINPNVSEVESLVRLPGVGFGRAEAIVAYRQEFQARDAGVKAFGSCDDMRQVKGIGPKTAENICGYLRFD